jgi:hypothetical protein
MRWPSAGALPGFPLVAFAVIDGTTWWIGRRHPAALTQ